MFMLSKLSQSIRNRAKQKPFRCLGAMALALDFRAANRHRVVSMRPQIGDVELVREAIDSINDVGFFAIDNFFNAEEVQELATALRNEICDNPSLLHPSTPFDKRLHGIENVNPIFQKFTRNTLLHDIACCYLGEQADVAFTLGAILEAAPGNPGSGGGWHRDNFTRQFKTMIYLSDVGPDDGPFQIVGQSHHFVQTVRDNYLLRQTYGDSRISDAAVMNMLAATDISRLHTLTGKAGTVLLFDSSTVHRGSPIKRGERLALTNYFFPARDINNDLFEHFAPVAGKSD